jgi:hypothetical protein
MLSRQEALDLFMAQGPDQTLLHHALETEAVLRGLAERLGQDVELWGITGLLHDLDFPQTKDRPEEHGRIAARELEGRLPAEALQAIKAHASEMNGVQPEALLDFALRCGESVTGLISANALVRPEGMEGMKPKSLKKKMKDKSFAANVSRDRIHECERIGLDLSEFFTVSIASIASIADEVGLS